MTDSEAPSQAVQTAPDRLIQASISSTVTPAINSPSNLNIFGAQIAGLLGMGLDILAAYLLWLGISRFDTNAVTNAIVPALTVLMIILMVLGPGAGLGLGQWFVMRRWIRRLWWAWVIASSVGLLILAVVGIKLFITAYTPLSFDVSHIDMHGVRTFSGPLRIYSWIMGAAAGAPCGLVFGLWQSLLLKAGRRRWWLACTLLGVFFGLIGAIIIVEGAIFLLNFQLGPIP